MSRPGDRGPYSITNVKIVLHEANVAEGWQNDGAARRRSLQKIAMIGKKFPDQRGQKYSFNGQAHNASTWAKILNIHITTFYQRLKYGMKGEHLFNKQKMKRGDRCTFRKHAE
jgi:hypothetical protein